MATLFCLVSFLLFPFPAGRTPLATHHHRISESLAPAIVGLCHRPAWQRAKAVQGGIDLAGPEGRVTSLATSSSSHTRIATHLGPPIVEQQRQRQYSCPYRRRPGTGIPSPFSCTIPASRQPHPHADPLHAFPAPLPRIPPDLSAAAYRLTSGGTAPHAAGDHRQLTPRRHLVGRVRCCARCGSPTPTSKVRLKERRVVQADPISNPAEYHSHKGLISRPAVKGIRL